MEKYDCVLNLFMYYINSAVYDYISMVRHSIILDILVLKILAVFRSGSEKYIYALNLYMYYSLMVLRSFSIIFNVLAEKKCILTT